MQIKIFVAMPFHESFLSVYEKAINRIKVCGKRPDIYRVDETRLPQNIIEEIDQNIKSSDIVIADLTDLNPNVFYEVGLAHNSLGYDRTILICRNPLPKVPFDLTNYRILMYDNTDAGLEKLRIELELVLTQIQDKIKYPKGPLFKTVEYYHHAKLNEDGSCEIRIKRIIHILLELHSIKDTWYKGLASSFKKHPHVEIEKGINLPSGCSIEVEHQPLHPTRASWRFIFSPPITERNREIGIVTIYRIQDAWRTTLEELMERWSKREVSGNEALYFGKGSMTRTIPSYYRKFEFRVEFPKNFVVQAPELLILSSGWRNRRMESALIEDGAFKVTKENNKISMELSCQYPVAGKYVFMWIPPSKNKK